ncbi:hypothetical protein TMatcc_009854 [Talaromyces marneffei ATCC 18224]
MVVHRYSLLEASLLVGREAAEDACCICREPINNGQTEKFGTRLENCKFRTGQGKWRSYDVKQIHAQTSVKLRQKQYLVTMISSDQTPRTPACHHTRPEIFIVAYRQSDQENEGLVSLVYADICLPT